MLVNVKWWSFGLTALKKTHPVLGIFKFIILLDQALV